MPKDKVLEIFSFFDAQDILALYLPGGEFSKEGLTRAGERILAPNFIISQSSPVFMEEMPATAEPENVFSDQEELDQKKDTPKDAARDNNQQLKEEQQKNQDKQDQDKKKDKKKDPQAASAKPLVGIYCTHNAEGYLPTQGVAKEAGKNSGIFSVATELQKALAAEGIGAVLCDTIHDYPDWNKSYVNSLVSMKKMKAENPSLQFFIDVHRDANVGKSNFIEIDGKKAAKVLFIVGSEKRAKHPNWQQNLAFAQKIGNALESSYPGILRGVRVQSGRYNQHFSPHAILMEMGSAENAQEDVQYSANLLAKILAPIIEEEKAPQN
ncbi:MAG: stage II sporulation protein P [Clostridiales bacterium]